jgi:MFS transporter, PPP family, 3-phenylpropionic acid transporter
MRAAGARRIRPAVAVQTLFVLFGVFIAASFPFLSLFLDGKGLTAGEIGAVIAAMAIARLLLSPLWGHLADTTLGRRRALQIGALGGAIGAFALFWAETYLAIVVAAFVFAGLSATVAPNVDAIALEFLGDDRMTEYGRIRGWESLAYAAACLLIGVLLQQVGIRWAMPVVASAALAIFVWAAVAIEPDRPARSIRHGRLGAVGAVFRAAHRFWMFLLALLLVWTGFNAAWNFIGLKIERAGGGPLLVGIGTALGGLVEVPVMRLSSRFSNRFGLRAVYVAGCVVYATGFLLWGLVEDPTILSVLTVFEGAGFALLFTAMVVVIGRMLPSNLYSTGQSLAATMGFGIAPIIGAGLGGLVFDRFGPATLYVGACLLTLCGGAVAWVALSTPALSRPARDVEPVL